MRRSHGWRLRPANRSKAASRPAKLDPTRSFEAKIHGEVDPADPRNRIIQDLELAPRNARGRVDVRRNVCARQTGGSRSCRPALWCIRSSTAVTASQRRARRGTSLSSVAGRETSPRRRANQTIVVPIARNRDGSALTGLVIARFYNVAAGTNTVPIRLSSMGNAPPPYPPADLEQLTATLTMHASESSTGIKGGSAAVPRQAWAFADCRSTPFPGTADPTQLCLKDGFDPSKLYELVYTAKDPLVLGIGLAATRDIVSFFRRSATDASGTANPIAGAVTHAIAVGRLAVGQFHQDVRSPRFQSGPLAAHRMGRRVSAHCREADAHELPIRAAGRRRHAVRAWQRADRLVGYAIRTRSAGDTPASLLDRCAASHTCPKVIEAFGASEFWGLRMSPGLIGTDAAHDIPLPENVRRYYYPGTTHGGGRGGFRVDAAPTGFGGCMLAANPNPEADTTRALTAALIEWVVKGTPPPPSRYPRLDRGELVAATKAALGFPDLPGLSFGIRPSIRFLTTTSVPCSSRMT